MTDFDQADCTPSTTSFADDDAVASFDYDEPFLYVGHGCLSADRAVSETGGSVDEQINRVFELAFQRLPGREEQTRSRMAVEKHGLVRFAGRS